MRLRVGAAVAVGALAMALFVAAPVTIARAADDAVDLDAAPASTWLGEVHYGLFRGEARVGWLRRALERSELDGTPTVVRTVEQFVDVAGDGNAQITLDRVTYRAASPQELLVLEHRVERQGRVFARRIVRRNGRFDVTTTRDGEEVEGAVTAFTVTLADELVLERLIALAATRADGPVGAELTGRGVAVGSVGRTRRRLGVRAVSGEGATLRFEVAVADGRGGWSEPVIADRAGALVGGDMGGGLAIRRMTRAEALRTDDLRSVEETTRVAMDARLGDLQEISLLRIRVTNARDAAVFGASPRQMTTPEDANAARSTPAGSTPGRLVLTVRRDADAGEVTDTDRTAALAPSPGIDSDAASIVAAATRALSGTSQRPVQVARLLGFVARTVQDVAVLTEPSASEILRAPRGDCSEHARLFVALARAAGIPAREVTGLVWMGDDVRAFGRHAWAEVELAGHWREVDPTGGVLPAHVAHVRVVDRSVLDGSLLDGALLDGVGFELLEAQR